jgi:DNA-binding transcriptional MerR regulator
VASAGQVEGVSVVLAKRAMARADVVVLVVDATEGAGDREGAIAGEAEKAGCGIVIAVNKWDLMKGRGQDFAKAFDDQLRFQLKFLEFAPIVRLSALTGDRTGKLLEVVDRVAAARQRRVPTHELNKFLERVTAMHAPTSKTSREVRILYGAQTSVAPPSFVLFTNVASELHFSYERYLTNQLREEFGFEGTPIRLTIRRRERAEGSRKSKAEGQSQSAILRRFRASVTTETIPHRSVFRAQEVCDIAQVQPYVLRSWESEFPELGVSKGPDGPRLYRRVDVELVLKLKHLLFVDGLTLAGARRQLVEEGAATASPDVESITDADVAALVSKQARKSLHDVRQGLGWILSVLNGSTVSARARGRTGAKARPPGKSGSTRAAKPVRSKVKPASSARSRASSAKPKRAVGRKKR